MFDTEDALLYTNATYSLSILTKLMLNQKFYVDKITVYIIKMACPLNGYFASTTHIGPVFIGISAFSFLLPRIYNNYAKAIQVKHMRYYGTITNENRKMKWKQFQ